jgi:competence ComEA-like helix-hairpin-helix protein
MKWEEFVKDYLSFTRKERVGILVISGLLLFVFLLPEIVSRTSKNRNIQPDTSWFSAVKKSEMKAADSSGNYYPKSDDDDETYTYQFDKSKGSYFEKNTVKDELFYFDPNTLSGPGWKKLGLRDKTIRTIQNYLSKGGKFNKPEDLQKIYGLHPDEFKKLSPYIKIEPTLEKKSEVFASAKTHTENQNTKNYSARYPVIDINSSDTTAFISLPGIGSKLAARIVNFRDKLGGFYSTDQVAETFGLPDSTFQKIKQYLKLENISLKKININTATVDELKTHPYIRYSLANPIIAYRNEHGPFSKIEDIKRIMAVSEEVYLKIAPYLTLH